MDDKLKRLLLKVRKHATEGFSMRDAVMVLEAMGCKVKKIFDDRKLVAVTVTMPDGASTTFEKLCGTRLGGYELFRAHRYHDEREVDGAFYKTNPVRDFTICKACDILGMSTVEEERADRKMYGARYDITNTGTCPCCFGVFKRENSGDMVHHGYRRPGTGEDVGKCRGEDFPPLEVSPAGCQAILSGLRFSASILEKQPADTDDEAGAKEFKLRLLYRSIKGFEALIAAWEPDELPEVRYAKKQPLKLQALVSNCY